MQERPVQRVTVVVVSFNTRDLLLRCLESLAPEVAEPRVDVWVLDNNSGDGSADAAREHAPWAKVIASEENLGFGRAVNLVAERTRSEWILIANADVALQPGALAAMLAAGRDPHVGCVAPQLVLPSGAPQHSVHPLPTVPLSLLFNLGLHRFSSRLGDRLCLESFWDPSRPRRVPWAIGACLLVRRSAFEAAGRFDEAQWMYAEDLDLAWRMRRADWHTFYEPRAKVLHESGAATGLAFGEQRESRFLAATYVMLERRRGRARMWATALINICGAAARVAWMTPLAVLSPRWRGPRAMNRRWLRAHAEGARMPSRLLSSP